MAAITGLGESARAENDVCSDVSRNWNTMHYKTRAVELDDQVGIFSLPELLSVHLNFDEDRFAWRDGLRANRCR